MDLKNVGKILFPYCLLGLYGALWISDEFDQQRLVLYAFFACPMAVLFYGGWYLEPQKVFASEVAVKWIYGLLFTCFSWGTVLFFNAITFPKPQKVNYLIKAPEEDRTVQLAQKKGGLGLLYRNRW